MSSRRANRRASNQRTSPSVRSAACSAACSAARAAAAHAAVEPLETRRLLSTINWTNKGTGAGAGDTDSFNAIYGGNATIARNIVQRAIDDWERVIVNFNYSNGTNTYNVTVNAAPISGRGGTGSLTQLNGKPTSAVITMDDNGGGEGWYFDPVIGSSAVPDDGEFTNILGPFNATFTGAGGANDDDDYYRTIAHELGHALGIAGSGGSSLLLDDNFTDIGDDPNSSDPADRLFAWNINGGPVEATFTNNTGTHFYEGPTVPVGGTAHPGELLNPGRSVEAPPTQRQLISDLCATVLRDAYGYTIALPSTINTFYANLNTTTNVVTLTGDANPNGSDADQFDLEVTGGSMRFEVNGTSEVIAGAEFSDIVLNAGAAADDANVDALLGGKTVTLNMGAGNDTVDVAFETEDIDNIILSNFTTNGDAGTDLMRFWDRADLGGADTWTFDADTVAKSTRQMDYNSVESLDVRASDNVATVFNIDGTATTTELSILSGPGADTFNVGNGDFDTNIGGSVFIGAGDGGDVLNVDDTADGATGDVYDFAAGRFSKPGQILDYTQLESISVLGSDQNSTWRINSTDITLTLIGGDGNEVFRVGDAVGSVGAGAADINALISINGGAGDDQYFVGNGDLDELSQPLIIEDPLVGGGTDTLTVNDGDDTGADPYTLVNGLLTKPGAGSFVSINYFAINSVLIDMNPGDNTFNFTDGFGFPTLQGNGGADTFNVISTSSGATTPVIRGGAGLDNVIVNEDETGTATAVFDADEDLNNLYLYEGGTVNVLANGETGISATSTGFLRGTLNLNDNFLVTGSSVAFVVDKITRGYNAGAWNGVPAGGAAGVVRSSTAAASAAGDGLGYAQVGGAAGQLNIAVYRGTPVAVGNLIVSYTLYGDNNLDRTVGIGDFSLLASNFNQAGTNWVRGNYNYDGSTGIGDFALLAANYNLSAADVPDAAARGGSAQPSPFADGGGAVGFESTAAGDRSDRPTTDVLIARYEDGVVTPESV